MATRQQIFCPHCSSAHTVRWGTARSLPRYRCNSCKHTFNILTNTPLARLRYKKRWLTYVGTMIENKSVRESAATCGVSTATSFRWQRRFLDCSSNQRVKIVAALLASYPGTSLVESAGVSELAWCKELLPLILSWIL